MHRSVHCVFGQTRAIVLGAALLFGAALPATGLWAGAASAAMSDTPTTTTLSSSQNPSFFGQPVTFTAVVAAEEKIDLLDVGGTVTFRNGGKTLCPDATLHHILGSWRAFCTTSTLPVGKNKITVTGSAETKSVNNGSQNWLIQVVLRAPTHLRANIFFNYHQTFTVTGTLDSFRHPVAHEPLIFKTGHTFLCVAFTNSHGIGACVLSYFKSVAIRQNAGRFTVIFPGTPGYFPSLAFGQGIIHP